MSGEQLRAKLKEEINEERRKNYMERKGEKVGKLKSTCRRKEVKEKKT